MTRYRKKNDNIEKAINPETFVAKITRYLTKDPDDKEQWNENTHRG